MTGQSFDWICFWGDYPSTTRENHCYTVAKHTPDAQPQGLLDGRKHGLIIVGLDAAGKTTWLYSGFSLSPTNSLSLPPSLLSATHSLSLTAVNGARQLFGTVTFGCMHANTVAIHAHRRPLPTRHWSCAHCESAVRIQKSCCRKAATDPARHDGWAGLPPPCRCSGPLGKSWLDLRSTHSASGPENHDKTIFVTRWLCLSRNANRADCPYGSHDREPL